MDNAVSGKSPLTPGKPLICFYDLDRTITSKPTWSLFLLRSAMHARPWRLGLIPAVGIAAALKSGGRLSRDRLKEVMHGLMLGRSVPKATMEEWANSFADYCLAKNIRPGALTSMAQDRAQGGMLVMATAAHHFYAEPIARRLNMDDVIATKAVQSERLITHRLADKNIYGPAKYAAVQSWLTGHGYSRDDVHIRFYSDHVTDAACLDFADEAFAVNPSAPLRVRAEQEGWNVVDWN
ncbi:HAD family hydrolase [Altericroceibacterium endophyticum]|uniref:HAD-IB family phosphatase n=1 Tax=Altericroceibacterium endophyticum TaxID=1808508 RepID=A0A6I4T6T8_9SPHN|nr:HAD-IB family phosphatase [Altericroceibacterium endophyticum]MXO65545.1 HAD-IB family phosphatase [Altericroceibacterium endophyticum]